MICNNEYLADILRVCEIKDLIWVMRFQSPLVYITYEARVRVRIGNPVLPSKNICSYFPRKTRHVANTTTLRQISHIRLNGVALHFKNDTGVEKFNECLV